jgi:methionine sulfoxide reductase heme-binding subunit
MRLVITVYGAPCQQGAAKIARRHCGRSSHTTARRGADSALPKWHVETVTGRKGQMPTLSTRRWLPHPVSDRAIRLGLKPLIFVASLWPAASVLLAAVTHQLNINPFNAIVRSTGFWSLRFLCLTLAITPFRWLSGWHSIVKFRRMMGLFAFFYGALHVLAYVVFDVFAGVEAFDRVRPMRVATHVLWAIYLDVVRRPFFAIGVAAFVLMVPLAATSTVGMIRRLGGRRWHTVHQLVYPAAIASVVHTYWPLSVRTQRYEIILGLVLALRLGRAYARRPQSERLAFKRKYEDLDSPSSQGPPHATL